MKALNDSSKFYMLNFNNLNNTIKQTSDRLSFAELKVFTYILKSIEFDTNIVTINTITKNYIRKSYDMQDKSLSKMFTKLKKMGIVTKLKKDTYIINKNIIRYGETDFQEGEYVKVNTVNTANALQKTDTQMSATDIEMLLDLLTTITYRKDGEQFGGNVVKFDKYTRKEYQEKFEVCSRSLDNFIKKLKEIGIVEKVSNGLYKVNESFIVFGGEFKELKKTTKEAYVHKNVKMPEHFDAFFNKKGGDCNE